MSTFPPRFWTWTVETRVFNYAMDNLNAAILDQKLDQFIIRLECAAKRNLAFEYILKNMEDGWFRYFYAHENTTLLDRCEHVCTMDDLAKLKDIPNKTDVIESMSCEDAFLPKDLVENHTIKCLTFNENTGQPYEHNLCLFPALALLLHGNERLEEDTSKIFNTFMNRMDGLCPNQFKGVHMNDSRVVEDLLAPNVLLWDIDFVDGNVFGELARRSMQKYENAVRLLRYNNHKCSVSNNNAVF